MSDLKTIRGMPDLYGENIEAISMVEETCLKTCLLYTSDAADE